MLTKTIVTAALAGGLAFGIGMPAQAAEATCSMERVLVSEAVEGTPAVYGEAPLLTPAQEAWIERVLVSPAVAEQSHVVHHDAEYAERLVIDQPFAAAVPAVEEQSHIVHHDAVVEVVHHDAEYTVVHHDAETKTVHHEAEVKVVHHEAQVTVVHHEAETKTVHHEAVTHTEYTRYSWTGGGDGPKDGDTPLTNPKNWNSDKKKYDGSETGVVLHQGKGKGSYFYWAAAEVVDQKAWDEVVVVKKAWDEKIETKAWDEKVVVKEAWDETVVVKEAWDEKVLVSEAWDEKVVVTEAWDEKVIDVEAKPGTPEQAEVSHLEYDLVTEAWDETVVDVEAKDAVYADVEHAAVAAVYGEPELLTPATEGIPAVYDEYETCISDDMPTALPATDEEPTPVYESMRMLPATGGGAVDLLLPIAAGAMVVAGVTVLVVRRRRHSTED